MTARTAPLARPLRISASSAISGLRLDRGTAILIGASAALVVAALLPVASLMGTAAGAARSRLEFSTVAGGGLGLTWAVPLWKTTGDGVEPGNVVGTASR